MDNYINNDPNNPINYNGKDIEQCNICQNDLNASEEKEEKLCFECIEEKEKQDFINKINELKKLKERKELEKQFLKFPELEEDENLKINLKAQREALNKIFDSFSIATIGSFDKDGNLI